MKTLKLYPKFTSPNHNPHIGYRLTLSEFSCKCNYADCTDTLVGEDFIKAWNISRALWDKPLKINSGFRCIRHNFDVGGKEGSRHKKGLACDIDTSKLDAIEKATLGAILRDQFDFVLEYPSFFHVQINE